MPAALFIRIVLFVMFIVPGVLSLGVGLLGSRWFFSSPRVFFAKRWGGRSWGARLFYILLGGLLLACGIIGLIDPHNLTPQGV